MSTLSATLYAQLKGNSELLKEYTTPVNEILKGEVIAYSSVKKQEKKEKR